MASLVASPGARVLVVYMAVLALCLACQQTRAQQPANRGAVEMAFDLPAQPLKQALAQYDAQTSLSVFFSSELAAGRTSTAVHGTFSPENALRKMLEGTGLSVQAAAADAFVLVPAPRYADAAVAQPPASAARQYEGAVQSQVYQALCARPALALGDYRLALYVQLNAAGHVAHVRLLDTTGDKARDAAIIETVEHVDVGQPPGDPAKAFVLLVKPVRCDAAAARSGSCQPPCGRQASR
ncbi:STN domain-containing protein [Cupriavidus basilensis]|uniref:STN domain-containing protein n=1 Tax=Cupriavidus basilensis TaxID=68895 RepID=UPI00157B255A|nr:STN domain-containing protein [Cupriavidus basilensis]NUA30690.1 hypothetical protein [Cupriavidus basilensis]